MPAIRPKPTMQTLDARVSELIQEQLGVDPDEVTPTAHLRDDLGADSLDAVELLMACEEEFGLEIPDEDAEPLATVQQLTEYLTARLAGK